MFKIRLAPLLLAFAMLADTGVRAGGDPMSQFPPRNWRPDQWFEKALSPRIANYRMEAVLDWQKRSLEGKETITWRNTGTASTAELPLHLYMNAFKGPRSLFFRESAAGGRGLAAKADSRAWGYCRLLAVRMDGDLLTGHEGEDETVYRVRLPRAVKPGESISVDVEWETQFPLLHARAGWKGLFLMAAQWFPKVGVYAGDRWICHAYHAHTEFFADFGTYDLELSMPNLLIPAHTGTSVSLQKDNRGQDYDAKPDPKRPLNFVWKLHAEDVHDFAFAVAPKGTWSIKRYDYRGVQVFYYSLPEHAATLKRQRAAVESTLRIGAEWFFPYPYPVLTVVDVPEDARAANGMEYPTLITSGSLPFEPFRLRLVPEDVAVHETAHQWFYGMLASDEVEHAWLDEGFTTWFAQRVMDRTYQALLGTRRFQAGCDAGDWATYSAHPSHDHLLRPGFGVLDGASYDRTFYAKGSLVLSQLEAMLGHPLMAQVMKAYAREMAFRHPTPADFKRIAERVSGRDLSAFWRDFVEGTDTLDITIHRVNTEEVRQGGWMASDKGMVFVAPQPVAPGRRGSITLLRRGGLRLPVTLWVRLEDRTEQRLSWDAQGRWTTFEFDSPVVAAVLDPDGNYPMLLDRMHASWTATPVRRGLQYWSQMLWGAFTALLQGAGLG